MLKKSLSQNLIRDRNLLRRLAGIAGVREGDEVLEIGAGQGDLTSVLCECGALVRAVELDREFLPSLERLRGRFSSLRVVQGDFLKMDFADLCGGKKVRVVGNIPYGITGPILFRLIEQRALVSDAFLTVQREVAERLASASRRRSYGSLSVVFQTLAEVKVHLTLNPGVFVPPPRVQSAFVGIRFRERRQEIDGGFPAFARACFAHKRKQLRRTLEARWDPETVGRLYRTMGFGPTVRAEEIEPEQFVTMYGILRETRGAEGIHG